MDTSRRHFLRTSRALALAGSATLPLGSPFTMSLAGMAALASQSARAADAGDYRALVCLYMAGGNDSHNWIVPTDTGSYAEYAASRGGLATLPGRLRPIASATQLSGRTFGLAEELQPLSDWYAAGRMAVIANVGPLDRPTTKSDFLANQGLPGKLFSHNDQTSAWQALAPEGAPSGWGGRICDALMQSNQNPVFTAISAGGNAVFLAGGAVSQYQVTGDGPVLVGALGNNNLYGSGTANGVLRRVLQRPGVNAYQAEYTKVMQRSLDTGAQLQSALAGTSVPPLPSDSYPVPQSSTTVNLDKDSLARQLRLVARLIQAGPTLGMRRQVFMVSIGGFDTHANQLRDQPVLTSRVARSVNWFLNALNGIGMLNNVTLFSASDFGRTLLSNGSGSDHGWGSHHFVVGGAVRGGDIYGRFPITAVGSSDDVGSGRLLPSTSVVEYAAPLGRWMGLSNTDLVTALPSLNKFSNTSLGFL